MVISTGNELHRGPRPQRGSSEGIFFPPRVLDKSHFNYSNASVSLKGSFVAGNLYSGPWFFFISLFPLCSVLLSLYCGPSREGSVKRVSIENKPPFLCGRSAECNTLSLSDLVSRITPACSWNGSSANTKQTYFSDREQGTLNPARSMSFQYQL